MKQRTLFGGFAVDYDKYYKHEPVSTFEKFIEAYYFFMKHGKTRNDFYKEATREWSKIKENENAVREIIEKHEKRIKDLRSKKKSTKNEFLKTSKDVDTVPIKNNEPAEVHSLSSKISTTLDVSDASSPRRPSPPSMSENVSEDPIAIFLDQLEPGLLVFIDTIKEEKLIREAINTLAKTYLSLLPDLRFYKSNAQKKRNSELSRDLTLFEQKIKSFTILIEQTNAINTKSSIGLSELQSKISQKLRQCNQIAVMAMEIKQFIDEKKIKNSLHRRVAQMKERNLIAVADPEAKLESLKFYCKNNFDLSWEEGIAKLATRVDIKIPENLGMKGSQIMHIASLLESSSIVALDEINVSNSVITLLLNTLPMYSVSYKNKTILVNFVQTPDTSDVIDRYFDINTPIPVDEKPKEKSQAKTKKIVYGPHKKRGAPSIVSKFPEIPAKITEFLKINGFKAQEKRRDDNFQSCGSSVKEIRRHLLKVIPGLAEHGIAINTIRYMFIEPHKGRNSSKRYHGDVSCRVPKKDNSLRKDTSDAHLVHSRVLTHLEHASKFEQDYCVVSADAMNKVHVGTLAVSRYHQIRKYFNSDEEVQYWDHDFPLGYKLVPCGYMFLSNEKLGEMNAPENETISISPDQNVDDDFDEYGCSLVEDDDKAIRYLVEEMVATVSNPKTKIDKMGRPHVSFKRTGTLVVCIRNAMFHHLTMEGHANDLYSNLKASGKAFVTIVGDNGPDMNPKNYINMLYLGRIWRDLSLSRLTCVTYPAGRSAYNPIEHAWSPLSNVLTGVTLPACLPEEGDPPCKQNLSEEEKKRKNGIMLENAATKLAKYWDNLRYDDHPVIPVVIKNGDKGKYDDHDIVEEVVYASKTLLDTGSKEIKEVRKEFAFFFKHADRRANCFTLIKCQLFKAEGTECDWCKENPPAACPALEFEKKLGGFFFDPIPSDVHENHYMTYMEQLASGKKYISEKQQYGRCTQCPNWCFSSPTELKRHRRLVHPNVTEKDLVKDGKPQQLPTATAKLHYCRHKVDNKPCDLSFPTYHQLLAHKKKSGHKIDRKRKAQEIVEKEAVVDKRCKLKQATIKSIFSNNHQEKDRQEEPTEQDIEFRVEEQEEELTEEQGSDGNGKEDENTIEENESDGEEEECQEGKCNIKEYVSKTIQWVQCVSCGSWWHKFCAGITDARRKFTCKECCF